MRLRESSKLLRRQSSDVGGRHAGRHDNIDSDCHILIVDNVDCHVHTNTSIEMSLYGARENIEFMSVDFGRQISLDNVDADKQSASVAAAAAAAADDDMNSHLSSQSVGISLTLLTHYKVTVYFLLTRYR